MCRLGAASGIVLLAVSNAAVAQSRTTCQWVGQVWTCNEQSQRSGIDWSILQSPSAAGNSAMDGFRQGMAMGEAARRSQAERERLKAETEYYRAQTEAIRGKPAAAPAAQAEPPAHIVRWLAVARPRMHLFPDFEAKVFAADVAITPSMVELMAGSELAADIAYYLATHRIESIAIAKLPLLEQARAISDIEREVREAHTPDVPATPVK